MKRAGTCHDSPLERLARARTGDRLCKSASRSRLEDLAVLGYKLIPRFAPEDLRGRLVMNAFLNAGPGEAPSDYVREGILGTPGTSSSIAAYLEGRGRKLIPRLVERELGDKWYTGPAKLWAMTPFGRSMVVDKVLEKTLPRIGGSTDLARTYLAAGGVV